MPHKKMKAKKKAPKIINKNTRKLLGQIDGMKPAKKKKGKNR